MEKDHELNPLKGKEKKLYYNEDEELNKIPSSIIKQIYNSNNNILNNTLTKKQTNEINVENSTIIGTKLVETDNNDERYLKAIKQKGEIAILKGENQLIEIIKLKTLEKILNLLGVELKEFYYDISFGIYSCEEIIEQRKTLETYSKLKNDNLRNISNYHNYHLNPEEQLEKISISNDIIFDTIQKQIDILNEQKKGNELTEEKLENKNENQLHYNIYKPDIEEENFKKMKVEDIMNNEKVGEENDKEKENVYKNLKEKNKEEKIKKGLIIKTPVNGIKKKKINEKRNNILNKRLFKPKITINKGIVKKKNNEKAITIINSSKKKEYILTQNKTNNKNINKSRNVVNNSYILI